MNSFGVWGSESIILNTILPHLILVLNGASEVPVKLLTRIVLAETAKSVMLKKVIGYGEVWSPPGAQTSVAGIALRNV